LDRHAVGQKIQNERYPNTVPLDARLPETDIRVNGNPGQQFFPLHDQTLFNVFKKIIL
jgi:hypothetical protein